MTFKIKISQFYNKSEPKQQPWELAVAFGNAVAKVFTYAVFFFRFYSVVDNS